MSAAAERRASCKREQNVILLIAGSSVFLVTAALFWRFLPRGGKRHRFVGTEWEPYVGVAFTSAVALAMTMMLSGVLDLLS
jgi:hypothetical protein